MSDNDMVELAIEYLHSRGYSEHARAVEELSARATLRVIDAIADMTDELLTAIRERDAACDEAERLRTALVEIAGWFIPGQRNTYLPGDQVLDRIRATADGALGGDVAA